MKLSNLLGVLGCNRNHYITIMEGKKGVATFKADEYDKVEGGFMDKDVEKVKITSPTTLAITLDAPTKSVTRFFEKKDENPLE